MSFVCFHFLIFFCSAEAKSQQFLPLPVSVSAPPAPALPPPPAPVIQPRQKTETVQNVVVDKAVETQLREKIRILEDEVCCCFLSAVLCLLCSVCCVLSAVFCLL